jgi:hypothetical protein
LRSAALRPSAASCWRTGSRRADAAATSLGPAARQIPADRPRRFGRSGGHPDRMDGSRLSQRARSPPRSSRRSTRRTGATRSTPT